MPLTVKQVGNVVHISGLNYEQFKLFQLSVLWRAGVSSHQFFDKVKLGQHAEELRLLSLPGTLALLSVWLLHVWVKARCQGIHWRHHATGKSPPQRPCCISLCLWWFPLGYARIQSRSWDTFESVHPQCIWEHGLSAKARH
jgi:hypothetical protein